MRLERGGQTYPQSDRDIQLEPGHTKYLQYGLEQFALPINAYRLVFWFVAGVALLGVIIAWGLRE